MHLTVSDTHTFGGSVNLTAFSAGHYWERRTVYKQLDGSTFSATALSVHITLRSLVVVSSVIFASDFTLV